MIEILYYLFYLVVFGGVAYVFWWLHKTRPEAPAGAGGTTAGEAGTDAEGS